MNRIKRRTINLAWKYVTRLFSNANNSNNAGDDDDDDDDDDHTRVLGHAIPRQTSLPDFFYVEKSHL